MSTFELEDRMYTVNEVAAIFSVTPLTVRIWIKEDKMQATKIGKSWRISKDAMIARANGAFGE